MSPIIHKERKAVEVSIENVSKQFGTQQVIDDVSLHVGAGETFVIMGPSGAGKSVLLKSIIGLITPSSGNVFIDHLNASAPQTHKEVVTSIVFQAGALFNSMSVFDNLALYPREHRLYDKKTLYDKVMGTLELLSLEAAAHKNPSELSGGMRKRVSIARSLMMEPQLLLYDEPTSELDPIMAATIIELIATLNDEFNVTSIVVSHDRELAMTIAQRVALMVDGRICALDIPSQLMESDDPIVQNFLNPVIDINNPRFRKKESS